MVDRDRILKRVLAAPSGQSSRTPFSEKRPGTVSDMEPASTRRSAHESPSLPMFEAMPSGHKLSSDKFESAAPTQQQLYRPVQFYDWKVILCNFLTIEPTTSDEDLFDEMKQAFSILEEAGMLVQEALQKQGPPRGEIMTYLQKQIEKRKAAAARQLQLPQQALQRQQLDQPSLPPNVPDAINQLELIQVTPNDISNARKANPLIASLSDDQLRAFIIQVKQWEMTAALQKETALRQAQAQMTKGPGAPSFTTAMHTAPKAAGLAPSPKHSDQPRPQKRSREQQQDRSASWSTISRDCTRGSSAQETDLLQYYAQRLQTGPRLP
ncbi:hypothetical protein CORC01_10641 [Colletotrichum orchidophilum]|uniref:Uncharacterized protein n=1 Tax=Colletotrichum orchidophilum TaxID=1209926 RepID=A0A1G4AY69_9PEZI|nr:uncharacterized protein CORC01_10641 [Colletotrichum orchidophilum]OHE94066.1 hypothetical protein CORC01_10641 [Colletotrichum orchidophilum]